MIQEAKQIVIKLLNQRGFVNHASETDVDKAVDDALKIFSDVDRKSLKRQVEEIFTVWQDEYRSIDRKRTPWLYNKKTSITWSFWKRYESYLREDKGLPVNVLNKTDKLTDDILDKLFDPSSREIIDRRGLVVGQVQSGKTSNYTGLICKAADAGFKLIIVLAGIHNNLRSQTQLRIDEGFLGFDTQHQRAFDRNNTWIGVGATGHGIVAHSLTSSLEKGDFSAGAANSLGLNFHTNEPIIAVVKKNARVLERLQQWLAAQATTLPNGDKRIGNKSLLLIDDEADNASINTNLDQDETTRINGLIRGILRLFDRSGYVGYTATPFANIFIPLTEDDLFPRDFIINLPPPSNYIGPEKVFGFRLLEEDESSESVLPIVRRVDDYLEYIPNKHKKNDPLPAELPDSLHLAIKCFIITCAIRRLRGQTDVHNSMLIHTSRFIAWQKAITELVQEVFNYYRRGIEMNIASVIGEFRDAFENDINGYKSYTSTSEQIGAMNDESYSYVVVHLWNDVIPHLFEAASRIQVKEINGGSGDILNYFDHQDGLSVIAIGGNKLSRGLTLEGLSISYYLRSSKMYDTLMQMGRWFGYRPGYADLCRLFISRELNEWFCHITLASQQLRDEFDYMSDVAGSTPDQYAVRVRTHPGVLQISASNKIRSAVEVRVSWSGRLVESYELSKNPEVKNKNLETTLETLRAIDQMPEKGNNYYLWRDVTLTTVKDFLRGFRTYENLKRAAPANILRYIEMNETSGDLANWAVGIISKERTAKRYSFPEKGLSVGLIKRSQDKEKSTEDLYYITKSHILSPNDEFIDLSISEKNAAMDATKGFWERAGKDDVPNYPNGEIVRNTIRKPNRPLLLIYFLDPEGAKIDDDVTPIIGFAISFPGNDRDDSVSFAINEQLLEQFNQQEDFELISPEDED